MNQGDTDLAEDIDQRPQRLIDVAFQVGLETFMRNLIKSLDSLAWKEFTPVESANLRVAMTRCGMQEFPESQRSDFFDRCSGECLCDQCGYSYREHPLDWTQIGYGNVPYLNVICDGRRVKL